MKKNKSIFFLEAELEGRERMTHKRLPVSVTLPQGHALGLHSVVAHPSDLQRIRDSKQQQSLKPEPNDRKQGQNLSKTETTKAERGATVFRDAVNRRESVFLQEALHALLLAPEVTAIPWGSRRPRWGVWLRQSDCPWSNQTPVKAVLSVHQMMSWDKTPPRSAGRKQTSAML